MMNMPKIQIRGQETPNLQYLSFFVNQKELVEINE